MKRYLREETENLLKEKSDQYLLYPSDEVWNKIHKELHPNLRWRYASIILILLFSASIAVFIKKEEIAKVRYVQKENGYQFIEVPSISLRNSKPAVAFTQNPKLSIVGSNSISKFQPVLGLMSVSKEERTLYFSTPLVIPRTPKLVLDNLMKTKENHQVKEDKKHTLSQTLDLVVETAKNIGKKISLQYYGGPSIGYRNLKGEASRNNYQYSVYSLNTNAVYARDVKDVVNHKPAMGFEIGTTMLYPLTKKLQLKAGLQANYNQYQIFAFKSVPEIATYGVNMIRPGSAPLSAVSSYRSSEGLSSAKLNNEHYMLSLPIGLDYRIAGTDKLNFSVASTVQPTFVFANYSYLLSANLRNYAKEPSLNRKWNVNGAVEASINFQQKGYRWSIAPQFRYQMLSSFKEKYPIKENLMDMGIKVGIIKTIK